MAVNIHDMTTKYDGRVLKLEVYVNSDENVNDVLVRVQKAARGQQRNAVFIAASIFTGDAGKEAWSKIRDASVAMNANPRAVELREDGDA